MFTIIISICVSLQSRLICKLALAACPYAMSSRALFLSGRGVGMDIADMSQKPSGVLFGAHC